MLYCLTLFILAGPLNNHLTDFETELVRLYKGKEIDRRRENMVLQKGKRDTKISE